MIKNTEGKLQPVKVGDCVAVFVSEFDRGRGDPANIIGIVLDVKNDRYKIGTKAGVISNFLERNAFQAIKYAALKKENVPSKNYSIREIVGILSVGNGQGMRKCNCKSDCQTNRCSCYKNKFKCRSACHGNKSCKNHDWLLKKKSFHS